MANPIPSMNAMVDSITDAVESAIHRGHHARGLRCFMLQGAVRRGLRDISDCRIPLRRFHGVRTGGSNGRRSSPRPSSPLQFAPGVYPTHGPPLPNHSASAEMWPTDFAYDLDVALPPPPPPSGPRSYADVEANCR